MLQLVKGNIVKIAFIITVIIVTFVIVTVMYTDFFEPEKEIVTPQGSLYFSEEPDAPGKYFGQFSGYVEHDEIKISILDASLGQTVIMRLDRENSIQIQGGLSMTYYDSAHNDKLDGSDYFYIEGGSSGDRINIIYRPTDESIASVRLP